MTQEELKAIDEPASGESVVADAAETQETTTTNPLAPEHANPRQVPLEALEAERRKRQDAEARVRVLQEMQDKAQAPKKEQPEDLEEFATKGEVREYLEQTKFLYRRDVLEESFKENNPAAVDMINANLETILKKKPWLAESIQAAPNRYARAYEIVQDYTPKQKEYNTDNAKRITENAKKPGNPASVAKPASTSTEDFLRSVRGKSEFREYRKKMLGQG